MSNIRKNHSAELSSRYGVHATVIHRSKKEAIESMTVGLSGHQERQQNDHAAEIKELHAKIGQLTAFTGIRTSPLKLPNGLLHFALECGLLYYLYRIGKMEGLGLEG